MEDLRPFKDEVGCFPSVEIGNLSVVAASIDDIVTGMADYCLRRNLDDRPFYATSVNGQVLSHCARGAAQLQSFARADAIHCDSQPMVLFSRFVSPHRFPERAATTDLFPAMAEVAAKQGISFYMLGASAEVNRRAVGIVRSRYPGLNVVGCRSGYFSSCEEEEVVREIARLKPDILWVSLGVPREQDFCCRNLNALRGVGIIKTSGGLFDFLAGAKRRAPAIMQRTGFEWLFRMAIEPRRLSARYLLTNPHAIAIMLKACAIEAAHRWMPSRRPRVDNDATYDAS